MRGGRFVAIAVLAGLVSATAATGAPAAAKDDTRVFEGPITEAKCGPGSLPETGLQGQVPREDRESGRSQKGYWCNMKLVGQHQGAGASWQVAWQEDCAYYGTYSASGEGVGVIDASKRNKPELTSKLRTPAMLGPWESLKVNAKRDLLAAVAAHSPIGSGPLFFDVYDVSDDCAQPRLLASMPVMVPNGHEGNWAQDGKTYYGASTYTGAISAIDVSNPTSPRLIDVLDYGTHGLATSADGNWLYLTGGSCGNGLQIVDVSEIQARKSNPQTELVGEVCWIDGNFAQHPIPVTIKGKPYIIFVDEAGGPGPSSSPFPTSCCAGAARLIDISDKTKPRVVSKFKLEIHMPTHAETAAEDTAGNGIFGYQYHYCNVDRLIEPTVLGCGAFQSGIRVIDIRNPMRPKEIAYYNPPAQTGKNAELRGSEHAHNPLNQNPSLNTDWCAAQVRFVSKRAELWTQCMDNGFLILKFTNGVWPFDKQRNGGGPDSSSG